MDFDRAAWFVVVGGALTPGPVRAADCPAGQAALVQEISAAEASFEQMDLPGFQRAEGRVREILLCLSEPLTPALAARVHRLEGLSSFIARDPARAGQAFAAARALDPAYTFPDTLLPPGHPARKLFESSGGQAETERVAAPGSGTLRFDGRESLDRVVGWPTILQRLDDGGGVAQTLYLWPGESPAWLQPAPVVSLARAPQRSEEQLRRWSAAGMLTAATISGVTSALLYRTARIEAGEYWDPATPDGDLDELRARVNTHQGLALGVGILGLGAGVGAALVFRWDPSPSGGTER